jgi:2-amino-4-hydroxy-6-hydroxymethyldihydropteridine diphosphokinase
LTAALPAYVGLGANLAGAGGTPPQALHAALDALGGLPATRLQGVSRLYCSDPVDAVGPTYFNQVACLQSELAPERLLDQLQSIEDRFGRERPYRNAPRTLDLDLLMMGKLQLDTPRLTLPHPRMHQRLFVLMPLAELAPDLTIPGHGTVSACLAAVQATRTQHCQPLA